MSLIFVDVEAHYDSPCPGIGGGMTEIGAVEFESRKTFYGVPREYNKEAFPTLTEWTETMEEFAAWLSQFKGHPVFVSDNPAYDWQWVNYWFHKTIKRNPFGFSARRIGDFYAGLTGDFRNSNVWKKLRVTVHDHNPVNDAMGNAEAFARMLKGER